MKVKGGLFSNFKGGVTGASFIGRSAYLKRLTDAAAGQKPMHVAIYGLPHVGKTSLVQEWARKAAGTGVKSKAFRHLIILSETVQAGQEAADQSGGCVYLCRRICRQLMIRAKGLQSDQKIPETDVPVCDAVQSLQRVIKDREAVVSRAVRAVADAIRVLGDHDVRTVIILDEFERAGQFWSEDDFICFMKLFLDETMNFFGIVVSRPHISYVVSAFTRKVIPFEPLLLEGFNDGDMENYLYHLQNQGGPDLKNPNSRSRLSALMHICGRNPFLLSLMASDLIEEPLAGPDEIYRKNKTKYETHYDDVIQFIMYEESKEQKSFSHIVKCYFGTSNDYQDIIENYIGIGYIELNAASSPYNFPDERFLYTDPRTKKSYSFTTVSPRFINYLFLKHLDEVRDTRDLLTGLIHTLRDVIRHEMTRLFSAESWNAELLLRMRAEKNGKKHYAIQAASGRWQFHTLQEIRDGAPGIPENSDSAKKRSDWIKAHEDQMTDISLTSLRFVTDEFNGNINRQMPSIDPISLLDTASVINSFPDRFAPYFGVLGDLHEEETKSALREHLGTIQHARNVISHFSRYALSGQEKDECRRRCVYLLKSLFSYYGFHEICAETTFAPAG